MYLYSVQYSNFVLLTTRVQRVSTSPFGMAFDIWYLSPVLYLGTRSPSIMAVCSDTAFIDNVIYLLVSLFIRVRVCVCVMGSTCVFYIIRLMNIVTIKFVKKKLLFLNLFDCYHGYTLILRYRFLFFFFKNWLKIHYLPTDN